MSRAILPLNALRAFESVARELSFTKAARSLHVSQAAISQQVKNLEARLGYRLIERGARQIALTETGRELYGDIRPGFELISNAVARLESLGGTNSVRLRLHPTMAVRWLMPRLTTFYQAHPDFEVHLATNLRDANFDLERFDIAIRYGRGNATGLESIELFSSVELFPICSPALTGQFMKLSDIRRAVRLHSLGRPHDWRSWLEEAGIEIGDPQGGPKFENSLLAYEAAINGVGVAIGQSIYVMPEIVSGALIAPYDISRRSNDGYFIVFPADATRKEAVRKFIDFLLEWARDTRTEIDASRGRQR